MSSDKKFNLDGKEIPFHDGDTIMDAALRAGEYIPHLCHNPEFKPNGSCRVCVVDVDGRHMSACTLPAAENMEVDNSSEVILDLRRSLLQMLFVEGNHICPACEKSGACQLQAVAYYTRMLSPHFTHFFPRRSIDASHPDIVLDTNRCILCGRCIRASRDVDGKHIFEYVGRGIHKRVGVNGTNLADTDVSLEDRAIDLATCPVGCIIQKDRGFFAPIGERQFDNAPIGSQMKPRQEGET